MEKQAEAKEENEEEEEEDKEENGEKANEEKGKEEYVPLHKLDREGKVKDRIGNPPAQVGHSKVTLDDFTLLKLVGKGGYGKVYQVQKKDTQEIFAMKVMNKAFLIKSGCVEATKTERDILRLIRHPFIVSLYYAFQTKGKVYLVMDYLNGGQLFFHLRNEVLFSEKLVRFYAAEVILAVAHLHSNNIIHRDLKPENLLLDSEGHIRLTDFGLSKENMPTGGRTKTYCGTVEYMAPEMITGGGYGREVDWWSVGILIYDMLTGSTPFVAKEEKVMHQRILKGKLRFPSYLSAEAVSIIKGLLSRDVTKRLGCGKNGVGNLKSHMFFKGMSWRKLARKEITPPFKPKIINGELDVTNFDRKYTSKAAIDSPGNSVELSHSQEHMFLGFSFVRSISPPISEE